MGRVDNLTNFVTDVAEAIREKTNTTDPIPCEDFDDMIRSISGGDEVYIIPKPDESVVGNYYIAFAIGSLGKDEESSDYQIIYGDENTLNTFNTSINSRLITCYKDSSFSIPLEIYTTQIIGAWFGSDFTATTISNNFLGGCAKFNQPIEIPPGVTTIGTYFLANCYSFNQPIEIPSGVTSIGANFLRDIKSLNKPISLPEGLISIGNSFMNGCAKFNQPIEIPASVTSIGTYFLSGCYSFNQPIEIPPGVTVISDSFLNSCSDFNQPIKFHSGVKSIGNSVLRGCYSFNQPIEIPPGVTLVDGFLLGECNNFVSAVTYNTSAMPVSTSLTTPASTASMYTQGIPISGTYASELIAALPNSSVSPYRNLKLA